MRLSMNSEDLELEVLYSIRDLLSDILDALQDIQGHLSGPADEDVTAQIRDSLNGGQK